MFGTENGFQGVENGTKPEFSCKRRRFGVGLVPNGVFHAAWGRFFGESSLAHIGRPPRRRVWQRDRFDGRSGYVTALAENQLRGRLEGHLAARTHRWSANAASREQLTTWPHRRSANSSTASRGHPAMRRFGEADGACRTATTGRGGAKFEPYAAERRIAIPRGCRGRSRACGSVRCLAFRTCGQKDFHTDNMPVQTANLQEISMLRKNFS